MRNVLEENWRASVRGWWVGRRSGYDSSHALLCCASGIVSNVYCSSCQVDLFKKTLLLIPIHLEVHWSLITVNIPSRIISFYDSQGIHFKFCVEVRVAAVGKVWTVFLNQQPPFSFSLLNFQCSTSAVLLSVKWESACSAEEESEAQIWGVLEWIHTRELKSDCILPK